MGKVCVNSTLLIVVTFGHGEEVMIDDSSLLDWRAKAAWLSLHAHCAYTHPTATENGIRDKLNPAFTEST